MPLIHRIPDFASPDARSKHTRFVIGDFFVEVQPPLPDVDYEFLMNWNETINSTALLGFGPIVNIEQPKD